MKTSRVSKVTILEPMNTPTIQALFVLLVASCVSGMPCADDYVQPQNLHWTPWYSSADSLTEYGEYEDQSLLCSRVRKTECRSLYGQIKISELDLVFETNCLSGRLVCRQDQQLPGHKCLDMEMRLLCVQQYVHAPAYQWSMSELDCGGTGDAGDPWNCDEYHGVQRIQPIVANITGVVRGSSEQPALTKHVSPPPHDNLCALGTDGTTHVAFEPFVRNHLTDPSYCKPQMGISVSFWFWKNESVTYVNSNVVTLHIFQSPSLQVTLYESHLVFQYKIYNDTWKASMDVPNIKWVHVTVTFVVLNDISLYVNGENVASSAPPDIFWTVPDRSEMEMGKSSFQIFSTIDTDQGTHDVTSSDIQPVAMTDLNIFYTALNAVVVKQLYDQKISVLLKVLRMRSKSTQFFDLEMQEPRRHTEFECLIRTANQSDLIVHFLHSADNVEFSKITDEKFYIGEYLVRQISDNPQYMLASLQLFGPRNASVPMPKYFTCEVFSAKPLSAYAYQPIEVEGYENLMNGSEYYWTKWFDLGPPQDNAEEESWSRHKTQAEDDNYDGLCETPIYADCRIRNAMREPWYAYVPPFQTLFNYRCGPRGIICLPVDHEGNALPCPDLEVRYACKHNQPASENTNEPSANTDEPSANTGEPSANTDEPSANTDELSANTGEPSANTDEPSANTDEPIANTDEPSANTDEPRSAATVFQLFTTTDITESQSAEKDSDLFIAKLKKNMNVLAIAGVVLSLAILPTCVACYFLCRMPTLAELIEARIYTRIAAGGRIAGIMGGRSGPRSGRIHPNN